MKTKMINRLIQETEQRLWDSSNLDDSLYYEQVLNVLENYESEQYNLNRQSVKELIDENQDLNDEISELEQKLEEIKTIIDS